MKKSRNQLGDLPPLRKAERSDRLPEGMESRLHLALAQASQRPGSRSRLLKPLVWATAISAACIAVFVAVSMRHPDPAPQTPSLALAQPEQNEKTKPIRIPLGRELVLNVNFTADAAMEEVDFLIELPKGLRFASDDPNIAEADALEWEGSLESGPNAVPIMIYGSQPGKWTLRAQVRRDGMERLEAIELEVENDS